MTNYRDYEDRNGFLKFFVSHDLEFEMVLRGLANLKGSAKWGAQAKELEDKFVTAFDGLICKNKPKRDEGNTLYGEMIRALHDEDIYFKPIGSLEFRRIHDECIRLFKEVSDSLAGLVRDDRRDIVGK
jgi:hypothetical protein